MLLVAMRARRAHRFGTAVRLMLALFALAAGQSVAARAEVAAPRAAVVRELREGRGPRAEGRVEAPETRAEDLRGARPLATSGDVERDAAARRVPIFLLNRALLH